MTGSRVYRIAILTDGETWMNEFMPGLVNTWVAQGHEVQWTHELTDLQGGDFAFFLSVERKVPSSTRALYRNCLVVHESDLPRGRGWSPMTWQVLEGQSEIPIVLFEAVDEIDAGTIYLSDVIVLDGSELVDELRAAQAASTIALCSNFVRRFPAVLEGGRPQRGEASLYRRRRPIDSELDPNRTICEQFNLLRVVDNQRYPAYVRMGKCTYELQIRKLEDAPGRSTATNGKTGPAPAWEKHLERSVDD